MAQQLSEFSELSHLSLNLENCRKVDEKVLYSSIQNISTQTSLTNLKLYFGETNIPDSFIMLGNLYQLKSLELRFGYLINEKISSIPKAIGCLKDLELLSLSIAESIESDKSFYCLADALSSITKLKTLSLRFDSPKFITDGFINCLTEPLSKLQELEHLHLHFPSKELTDQGVVEIAFALPSLRKLVTLELDLSGCQNTDTSLEVIGNLLLKINQIRILRLNFGEGLMTSHGILSFGRSVSKLYFLEELRFRFHTSLPIEGSIIKSFGKKLKELKGLRYLLIDFPGFIYPKSREKVMESLKNSLPFLKKFYFWIHFIPRHV